MKTIHKIAAMVIKDDKFLMVRKEGKDIWTNLGGKPEGDETEEKALIRETQEELDCEAKIIKKLGNFEAPAVFDEETTIRLSTYLVEIVGEPKISDPELEEFRYIGENYKEEGIKFPDSIVEHIIPYCIKNKLLNWKG